MKPIRIQNVLAARGCMVLYASLRRLFRKRNWERCSGGTVRMTGTEPGAAAEAGFGRFGMITGWTTGKSQVG